MTNNTSCTIKFSSVSSTITRKGLIHFGLNLWWREEEGVEGGERRRIKEKVVFNREKDDQRESGI